MKSDTMNPVRNSPPIGPSDRASAGVISNGMKQKRVKIAKLTEELS